MRAATAQMPGTQWSTTFARPLSSTLFVVQRRAACCTPWGIVACCSSHCPALSYAADLVEHLLSNRADPQPLDHFGATPLSRARFYRRESVIAVLEPYAVP